MGAGQPGAEPLPARRARTRPRRSPATHRARQTARTDSPRPDDARAPVLVASAGHAVTASSRSRSSLSATLQRVAIPHHGSLTHDDCTTPAVSATDLNVYEPAGGKAFARAAPARRGRVRAGLVRGSRSAITRATGVTVGKRQV